MLSHLTSAGARNSNRAEGRPLHESGERESRWSTIVELDEPIAVGSERQARFREYLNAGVELGFMTDAACAHPQGSLERMRLHSDLIEREFYEDVYAAVKGRYRIKPPRCASLRKGGCQREEEAPADAFPATRGKETVP